MNNTSKKKIIEILKLIEWILNIILVSLILSFMYGCMLLTCYISYSFIASLKNLGNFLLSLL